MVYKINKTVNLNIRNYDKVPKSSKKDFINLEEICRTCESRIDSINNKLSKAFAQYEIKDCIKNFTKWNSITLKKPFINCFMPKEIFEKKFKFSYKIDGLEQIYEKYEMLSKEVMKLTDSSQLVQEILYEIKAKYSEFRLKNNDFHLANNDKPKVIMDEKILNRIIFDNQRGRMNMDNCIKRYHELPFFDVDSHFKNDPFSESNELFKFKVPYSIFYGYQFSTKNGTTLNGFTINSSGIIFEGLQKNTTSKRYGRLVYPDGSYYIGWTRETNRHGNGTYYKEDQILKGEFRNNKYLGSESSTDGAEFNYYEDDTKIDVDSN